jgi:hypothetical protein
MAGFEKEIKQNRRQCNAERRSKDSCGLGIQRMFEGVSEEVETQAQEKHRKKAGQTSEGTRQTSANDQRFDVVGGDVDQSFCAHSSPLAGASLRRDRILDAQKVQICEVRRRVFLFMGAPQTQSGLLPAISAFDRTKTSQ